MISWAFPYQKQRRRVLERRPALTWVRQISGAPPTAVAAADVTDCS
jgi:hypothetical protein